MSCQAVTEKFSVPRVMHFLASPCSPLPFPPHPSPPPPPQRDPSQRLFRVRCTRTDIVATLDITFPAFYPNNAPPFFIIDSLGTNLDTARQQNLLQVRLLCHLAPATLGKGEAEGLLNCDSQRALLSITFSPLLPLLPSHSLS